jgi:MFS family permease
MWFALIVSSFGDFLALYAVLSVASFRMNANAAQITGVQIASLLPIVIMGPLAGVFVDRWPLKRTMVCSDVLRVILTLLLLGATQLWHFYAILALISIVSGFFGPAQQCTIRFSVPPEGMMAVSAIMQQAIFLIRVISPGIAGLMVASFGAKSCFWIDSLSFAGSAMLIGAAAIQLRPPALQLEQEPTSNALHGVWRDMRVGFEFIARHHEVLFVVIALSIAVFTLGCFGAILAVYVRESLHGSTRLFGLAGSLIGVGILFGFFSVQRLAKSHSNQTLVFGGLLGMGAGNLLLGVAPFTASALSAIFAVGFSVAAILLPAQTLLQQETPAELMGRVNSTGMSIVFGAQVLGLFFAGLLAKAVGVQGLFTAGAVLLIVISFAGRAAMQSGKL